MGQRLVFREGRTKAVGNVIKMIPVNEQIGVTINSKSAQKAMKALSALQLVGNAFWCNNFGLLKNQEKSIMLSLQNSPENSRCVPNVDTSTPLPESSANGPVSPSVDEANMADDAKKETFESYSSISNDVKRSRAPTLSPFPSLSLSLFVSLLLSVYLYLFISIYISISISISIFISISISIFFYP
jgi:hypothetical protein